MFNSKTRSALPTNERGSEDSTQNEREATPVRSHALQCRCTQERRKEGLDGRKEGMDGRKMEGKEEVSKEGMEVKEGKKVISVVAILAT